MKPPGDMITLTSLFLPHKPYRILSKSPSSGEETQDFFLAAYNYCPSLNGSPLSRKALKISAFKER